MNITVALEPRQAAKISRKGPLLIAELMRFLTVEEAKATAQAIENWQGPVDAIQREVSDYYDIPLEHMTSMIRLRKFAWPRQRAMWLTRELTGKSLPDIGEKFGGRDHTTVIHAIRAVNKRMESNPLERAQMKTLAASLEHFRRQH